MRPGSSMKYFVIAADGQRYGPADIPTLNQWIAEGRINAQTLLGDEAGEPPVVATLVPGLEFGGAQTATTAPSAPVSPAYPTDSLNQPSYVNYPRGGQMVGDVPTNFNWGAFFFTWIWGLNHKAYITLIVIVLGCIPFIGAFVNLGLAIWFGTKGNQWAWESGRFSSIEDMMECQRIWAKWALWWFVIGIVVGILYLIVAVPMMMMQGVRPGLTPGP